MAVMANQHAHSNRLINQKSPYLLQHAHNPVDWYPWGDEAFQAARNVDKPIFLSIGYATCHWCHVMEKESFEDTQIAKLMNDAFINIKVDREELPEIDSLYMEFAQSMMSGAAGWPLNLILTPELQPFFAATYLPPHNSHGLMGLTELIMRIKEVWQGEDRETVLQQAAQVVEVFAENVHAQGDALPEKEDAADLAELLFKMADPVHGGMKGTPKFPIGYQYNFILRYASQSDDPRAIFLVDRTLDMMQRGGIFDHLGGGFSRYSVDSEWLVPHFEKMLYDNALLAYCYLETWQLTKNPMYKEICESILDYVLNTMTHSEGGFYSAEDADSDGHEGLFYTWTPKEAIAILGEKSGKLFNEFYNVTEGGNFENRNVLNTKYRAEEFAKNKGIPLEELTSRLKEIKEKMRVAREKRVHPLKDDKILSSWNGLMIHSMVEAGRAFQNTRYVNAAVKAAKFIKRNMWKDKLLLRRWRDGEAMFNAGLDEYAFLIRGVLSLYEADCGTEWLAWAMQMSQILTDQFKAEEGAFYQTDGSDPNIILRKCQFADGAEPSGNAMHGENLLRLYQITGHNDYLNQSKDILKGVKKYFESYAPGYCYHMINLLRYYDRHAPTFVIALNEEDEWAEQIRNTLYGEFIPHKSIIWRREGDKELFQILPSVKEQGPVKGKTTLYLCYMGVCQKPLNDIVAIQEAIRKTASK